MPKSGGERRSTSGEKAGEGFSVRNVHPYFVVNEWFERVG